MEQEQVIEKWQGTCIDDGTGKNVIYVNHLGQVLLSNVVNLELVLTIFMIEN